MSTSKIAIMPYEDYEAACNKIREYSGKVDPIKSGSLAAEIEEIAGKQAEQDLFWDIYQFNGERDIYFGAFCGKGWKNEIFKPKYDIKPTNLQYGFYTCNITNFYNILIDRGIVFDTSECTNFTYAFSNCWINQLPRIDVRKAGLLQCTFNNSPALHTIDTLVVDRNTQYKYTFGGSGKLANLTIEGVIGQNGFDVSDCTLLTHDSLMSIINCLQDKAVSTKIGGVWKFNDIFVGDAYISQNDLAYSVEGEDTVFNLLEIYPFGANAVNTDTLYVVDLNGKTVDFGTTPQTISEQAAEWIAQNATSQGGTITTEAGSVWTITLGATNLAKLTDAEKARATQKGWTLA